MDLEELGIIEDIEAESTRSQVEENKEDDLTKSVTNDANAEVPQETNDITSFVQNEGEEKLDREEAQAQEEVASNNDRASAGESLKSDNDDEMDNFSKKEEISKNVKDHHKNVFYDDIKEENDQTKESIDQDSATDNDKNLSNQTEKGERESEKETADVAADEDDQTENEENNNIEEESDQIKETNDSKTSAETNELDEIFVENSEAVLDGEKDSLKQSEKEDGESERATDQTTDVVMDERVEDHKTGNNTNNEKDRSDSEEVKRETKEHSESETDSSTGKEGKVNAQSIQPCANEIEEEENTPGENIPEIESSTQMDVPGFEDNFDPAVHVQAAQLDSEVRELKYQLERAERRCSLSDKVD